MSIHSFDVDVYISSSDGEVFDNNSVVPSTKTGGDSVLVCHTDKQECCQNTTEGIWIEIETKTDEESDMTYDNMDEDPMITRGDGTINLTSLEIGTFCCSVPNAISVIQTVCVNSGQYCSVI